MSAAGGLQSDDVDRQKAAAIAARRATSTELPHSEKAGGGGVGLLVTLQEADALFRIPLFAQVLTVPMRLQVDAFVFGIVA